MRRPYLWSSIPASGGCVGTSQDIMCFIKAFFKGELFDQSIFKDLRNFNTIQYCPPLGQYGGGFVRLDIAGLTTLYQLKGELIGHMGASGSYAYYYPEKDLYFVGDMNQFARTDLIFSVPVKLAKLASKWVSVDLTK